MRERAAAKATLDADPYGMTSKNGNDRRRSPAGMTTKEHTTATAKYSDSSPFDYA
jgi:hypothetical protein